MHHLYTNSKVIQYLNNSFNGYYVVGRNFEETSKKLVKTRNIILNDIKYIILFL